MTVSECQICLLPERAHQRWSSLHGAQPIACAGLQVAHVLGAAIGQLVMPQMSPYVFGGIQLWSVRRQRRDLHSAFERFQILAHQRAAMDWRSIQMTSKGCRICCPKACRNSMTCGPLMAPGNRRK